MNKYLIIASIVFLTLSCDTNTECGTFFIDQLTVDFKAINNQGTLVDDPQRSVWDSIFAENSLEPFYTLKDTVSNTRFSLGVNAQQEELTYFFKRNDIWDTLKISYRAGFRILSPECGIIYQFRNLKILEHTFDSAWVRTDSLVRNSINIEIIY